MSKTSSNILFYKIVGAVPLLLILQITRTPITAMTQEEIAPRAIAYLGKILLFYAFCRNLLHLFTFCPFSMINLPRELPLISSLL